MSTTTGKQRLGGLFVTQTTKCKDLKTDSQMYFLNVYFSHGAVTGLPSAFHLDSKSRSRSSCRAFPGPPSPLGSRGEEGEEEEDEEGGDRGPLSLSLTLAFFLSLFFQLTNWQVIDGYLFSLTMSSISITKAMYSRVGQTVNYMLPPTQLSLPSLYLSLTLTLSLSHSTHSFSPTLRQANKTKQSMLFVPRVSP